MKKYKEDAVGKGFVNFRFQGLLNYKDAYWSKCQAINCSKLEECENNFLQNKNIACINPLDNKVRVRIVEAEKKPSLEDKYARHNVTANAFLDYLIDHLEGSATPTLEVDHAYFTSRFDPPDADTTVAIDDHQVGSNITITKSSSGRTLILSITLATSDVNCLDTTVDDASFTPTTTVFDLDSVTGLDVGGGDKLQITLATYGLLEREIASISTKRVTITQPLPAAPVDGDVVRQILSNMYICMADDTVISADSYGIFKDSSISRVINADLRLNGG